MFKILIMDYPATPSAKAADEGSQKAMDEGSQKATLCARLSAEGYQLELVRSHDDMMAHIKSHQPDLILLDPHANDKAAYLACEHLRGNPNTENIPLVFLDAHPNSSSRNGEVIEGFNSGATDFINLEKGNLDETIARIQATLRIAMNANKAKRLTEQLTQMNAELYERNSQVEKELYTTRQLQQSLLPPFLKDEEDSSSQKIDGKTTEHTELSNYSKCHYKSGKLRITGVYLPCDALGGDIYDVSPFPNETVGVSIADVSGHGVPAAFITAIFKSSFYRTTHNYSEPGDILFHLNNELLQIIKTGQYVTAVYCRIYQDGRKLQYSGAGHPYPVSYNAADKSITRLKENGTPLAWFKDMEYPMGELRLDPGDKVLLFSDGVSEMKTESGAIYGEEDMIKLFVDFINDGKGDILNRIIHALSDFAQGHPLEDDISMVLIEAL